MNKYAVFFYHSEKERELAQRIARIYESKLQYRTDVRNISYIGAAHKLCNFYMFCCLSHESSDRQIAQFNSNVTGGVQSSRARISFFWSEKSYYKHNQGKTYEDYLDYLAQKSAE